MNIYDDEIVLMWKALAQHEVRYIMIGCFAVNYHGFSRTTGDLDLWIEDTIENRKRLGEAFGEVFSEDFSSFETMQFIPDWTSFRFDSGNSSAGFRLSQFSVKTQRYTVLRIALKTTFAVYGDSAFGTTRFQKIFESSRIG